MNLVDVMREIGTAAAETLAGPVKVYVGAPPKVDPPARGAAIIVPYPTGITYDGTYGRGMDTIAGELYLLHPRPTDDATPGRVAAYASGSGPNSVKACLEGYAWTTCHGVRVAGADFDAVTYAEVDYMAARFTLEIWGQGS